MNSFVKHHLKLSVAGYVEKGVKNISAFTRFDMGENFLPPTPKINRIIKQVSLSDLADYPDHHYKNLTETIVAKFNIDQDNILLTNGADEAISLIPRALCEPGDTSIIPVPNFFRIIECNNLSKINNHYINLLPHNHFAYDQNFLDEVIADAKQTRATSVWICTPNNPTGNVLRLADLKYLLNKIPRRCHVIIDEVYHDFYDPNNKLSAIKLIKKNPNLIVLRSLSKSHCLANIRLGFIVANKNTISSIKCVKPVFNISGISEKIATIALRDTEYLISAVNKVRIETTKLIKKINQLKNLEISHTECNVFLLKHKFLDIYEELIKRKILPADFRQSAGVDGLGFVRITVQKPADNLLFIKALTEIDRMK